VSGVNLYDGGGSISFQGGNWFSFSGTDYFSGDDSRNLSYYEPGDRITIKLTYDPATRQIISVDSLTLVQNSHVLKGDVDGSGEVTVADAVLLAQYILGKHNVDIASYDAADADSDGRINSFDLIALRDIISGK
ncbi:MAG: dockerin type I repeat-containing protein, partial [Ruminococcus sp.]|nr:dockerin type I repeat-containing protein [Ruminococcus sp.]